ncbi:phospholipid carrier-dependent glycosyltransferase [Spirillospora sp. NPDC050679]
MGAALVRWTAVRGHPGVLWFTGDSYFYVGRALRPEPSPSKTLGYPFLLRLLEPLHSLTAVAVLQHLMGLAVGVLGYAVLRRAGLRGWLAALVTLPVLYDAYQVELEHMLMSEALFTFLIAAALALLLWRAGDPRAAPGWAAALAAGLLLGFAVLVRSAGAPLIPGVLLCLLLWRGGWRPALAFGAAAAVPVAAYAAWFHSAHGNYALTSSDGLYLWGRTAVFADCAKMRPPSHMEALCLTPELKAQGLAPGHLIWRSEAPPRVLYESTVAPESNEVLRDFAIRAILAQPGDYAHEIVQGVGKAFSPHRYPVPTAATEALYHFPERPHVFPGGRGWGGGNGTALSDAMRYGRTSEPSRVVQPHARRIAAYQRTVHLPGPALGAVFAAGAVGIVLGRRRRAVLLAWGTAVTLLVFPIASADFDYRYVVPAAPFACLALGLALSPRRRGDGGETGPVGEAADGTAAASSSEGGVSRWWGTRGSPRRGSGRATAP